MASMNRKLLGLALGGCAVAGMRAALRAARALDLRDKVVFITGGSRGLGLLLAREFGRYGARVAVCARDNDEVDRALADLAERGVPGAGAVCDVTDPYQVRDTLAAVRSIWGPIDVLVNNAGVIQVGPMEVMNRADYEEAMAAHFWAPLYTTMAVLPEMKARGSGRIVNVASIGGKVSVPHLLPYCASKFALVGFSEGLRAELAKDGIRVTTVIPGLMRTGSPRNAFFKSQFQSEYAWFKISDSLPLVSMSAQRAARRIVSACRHGDAEVVLGLPAQAAVLFHGLFPGLTSDLLGLVNRTLPGPGGALSARVRGEDAETPLSESFLTVLTARAERAYNELGS
jgi:NAD(P)-dependent dehydrogenase (short-subunit alcohol dehydrogenase family)